MVTPELGRVVCCNHVVSHMVQVFGRILLKLEVSHGQAVCFSCVIQLVGGIWV